MHLGRPERHFRKSRKGCQLWVAFDSKLTCVCHDPMTGQKIGYARVSSTDQNLDRQLEVLNGLSLNRMFTDKVSGKNIDRSGLQEMLRFVREDDHLFVCSMDRLARNLVDLRRMISDLTAKKVVITFIKENLTFSGDDSPMSILLLNIMGAVSEFERTLIKERQAEGIKLAKQRGIYKGKAFFLNAEQVADLRSKVDSGIPKTKVAKSFGISRETLYRYLLKNKEAQNADTQKI